ncbi:hypothetical protein [Leptospira kirschneri]|uniref:hypothetical protein n=1 Tax=Leptospira kirschneri TaxID=29507 RepID=UPI00028807F1|nr:hypothetical protein [Leptospira kirschneri]EKQ85440.1 hypothetical protein LEP1GSC064_0782 [Leptospira kirschneri serovar Grippotyphosa str. Moskva]EKR09182.1 hypothetical protein LEP1GSC122_0049 [Leptospira kirschneri serovar Valbuzzi str. 200702274]EMK03098.1 hypothetical protein LEP1GSC176_0697 [Leptospira kirschneri str. MMD1493]EMN26829.1 hypothetical protein LEP1GSC065_2767 [Leptospira kirschneri serovar Sokoine str. RM1]EMK13104.1 hypothetical protein LEP1GSC042_0828 [Leptospira kir
MSFSLYQKDQAARFYPAPVFSVRKNWGWIGSYKSILKYYDIKNQIAWDWASMDSAMVKASTGGA